MLLIWRRWRGWRRGRPFWGGLFTVLAALEIGVLPLAPMKVMLHQGTAGIPGVVLAAAMVVLGLSGWFAPQYRGLAGILTVLLATAALVLSNLGGFMIGTLLGVVGGALIFAWRPVPAAPPEEPASGAGPEDRGAPAVVPAAAPAVVSEARSEAPASEERQPETKTLHLGRPEPAAPEPQAPEPERPEPPRSEPQTPEPARPEPKQPSERAEPKQPATEQPEPERSGSSSLAAAFGVDEDPPTPPRDTSRTEGQD
jgi:hypothetical protein